MPDLKKVLGEELYNQVNEKLDDNHVFIDKSEGEWVPKEKFSQTNDEVKDLKKQLKDRDSQLEDLQGKAKGNEDLQQQIKDLQDQNKNTTDEYEKKLNQQAFDHALDKSLSGAKAKNPKAVKALLNTENIKLDGDKLIGLDDQLKDIKEKESYLFNVEDEGNTKPTFSNGNHKRQSGNTDPFVAALGLKGDEG